MSKREEIARRTLAACDAGYYELNGARIELAAAVASAVAGTRLYELGVDAFAAPVARHATRLSVTAESTLDALVRLTAANPAHLGALNFASAKNPGGGFLRGAQAQEEAIARSSGLYPCLLEQPSHYARNRAGDSLIYLDLAIYAPRVPVFRDDDGGWFSHAMLASIITCAAPNKGALANLGRLEPVALEAALRRRAELVLAIAAHHGITHLVLGAWGCGVFRNDPALVADAFARPLAGAFAGVFEEVVFAIVGGAGGANYEAFAAVFG